MRLWILPLFLTLVLHALPASATVGCECSYGGSIPSGDRAGFPLNGRFVFLDAQPPEPLPRLLEEGRTEVPLRLQTLEGGGYALVPEARLRPQTTYQLSGERPLLRLVTGTAEDREAPAHAPAMVAGGSVLGACPSHYGAVVRVTDVRDADTPIEGLLLQVRLRRGDERAVMLMASPPYLFDEPRDGGPGTQGGTLGGYLGKALSPGWDRCLPHPLGADGTTTYHAQVSVIDWAGNASPPGPEIEFRHSYNVGCGCQLGGAPPPASLGALFALLCLVLLPRLGGGAMRKVRRHLARR